MIGKTTLYTGGRYGVSHQYELLNVSARLENLQSFLYRGSTQMVSHQYALLNDSAAWMYMRMTWHSAHIYVTYLCCCFLLL